MEVPFAFTAFLKVLTPVVLYRTLHMVASVLCTRSTCCVCCAVSGIRIVYYALCIMPSALGIVHHALVHYAVCIMYDA